MSNQQEIRDRTGMRIGYTIDGGAEIHAYAHSGWHLGRYDKRQNVTYDASCMRVGSGNQTIALIWANNGQR